MAHPPQGPSLWRMAAACLALAMHALWATPLAWLYGLWVLGRRKLYDAKLLPIVTAPLTVVCIGGLEAGGTGKTPVTAHVIAHLLAQGRKPGLLSRGYRRRSRGLVVRRAHEPARPGPLGDEVALVLRSCDVPAAVCARRHTGAQALKAMGCDCAVMDDGFAHRALARKLDILVLRGEQPLDALHLLPLGSLREPASSLTRAGLIWLHYRHANAPQEVPISWRTALNAYGCHAPVLMSHALPGVALDGHGRKVLLAGARVVGAAGIARPQEFAQNLVQAGAEVVRFLPLADHHPYSDSDVAYLGTLVASTSAQALVVTPKDAVKLEGRLDVPLWTLDRGLDVIDPGRVLQAALTRALAEVVPQTANNHRP